MTKKESYTQCFLTKHIEDKTYLTQTAYIPTKFAKTGHVIKLMKSNGEWEDGWCVEFVYGTVDDVVSVRQSIKRHRENTGDSLPKIKDTK